MVESAGNPVRLDPLQNIVNVHWRTGTGRTWGLFLDHEIMTEAGGACSPAVGHADSGYSRGYISGARLWPNFDLSDGNTITLSDGSESTECTISGFPFSAMASIGEWAYAYKPDDPIGTRTFTASGLSAGLVLGHVDALDGGPVCMAWGVFNSPYVSSVRAGTASADFGPIYDFSGVTATEIGGAGRVFHVSAIDVSTFGTGNGALRIL